MGPEQRVKEKVIRLSKDDMVDLKANINAMLFVLTDFLTLQTELMKKLIDSKVLTEEQVQAIYAATGNKEIVEQVHAAIYSRYANYFEKSREVIREDVSTEKSQTVDFEGVTSTVFCKE